MSTLGLSLYLCGYITVIVGVVILVVADEKRNDDFKVVGFLVCVIGVVVLLISMLATITHNDSARSKANKQIDKTCFPLVATNRAEDNGYVVFDCGGDGKLRRVKVLH